MDWDKRIRLAKKSWNDSRIRLAKKWDDSRIRLAKKDNVDSGMKYIFVTYQFVLHENCSFFHRLP